MIRASFFAITFAACGSSASAPRANAQVPQNVARADPRDDACEMIAAILAVRELQRFYNGVTCGEPRQRPFVKIVAHANVVPPKTTCSAYGFLIFHGERDLQGVVLVLEIGGSVKSGYGFNATYDQPNETILPDGTPGGFTSYSCMNGGTVVRENGRWVGHAGFL